jgi:hypothetical protein
MNSSGALAIGPIPSPDLSCSPLKTAKIQVGPELIIPDTLSDKATEEEICR